MFSKINSYATGAVEALHSVRVSRCVASHKANSSEKPYQIRQGKMRLKDNKLLSKLSQMTVL